jgi:hypothetical protein
MITAKEIEATRADSSIATTVVRRCARAFNSAIGEDRA